MDITMDFLKELTTDTLKSVLKDMNVPTSALGEGIKKEILRREKPDLYRIQEIIEQLDQCSTPEAIEWAIELKDSKNPDEEVLFEVLLMKVRYYEAMWRKVQNESMITKTRTRGKDFQELFPDIETRRKKEHEIARELGVELDAEFKDSYDKYREGFDGIKKSIIKR